MHEGSDATGPRVRETSLLASACEHGLGAQCSGDVPTNELKGVFIVAVDMASADNFCIRPAIR